MTEIAVRPEQAVDTAPPDASPLVVWAREAQAAHGIAKSLAATPFVPESFGRDPNLVTAAILVGQEVGLQPMAALRSMDIVKGTPALRAIAMRGLVQAHGHEVWPAEQTETRVVMRGRRKGTTETVEVTWTMDRAKKLGVAGGRNYQTQPMTMLIARATSEVCRLIAADVLLGIPYSVEELADDPAPAPDAAPARSRRTAQRRPLAPVPTEPAVDEVPDPNPQPVEDPAEPTLKADWPDIAQPGGGA